MGSRRQEKRAGRSIHCATVTMTIVTRPVCVRFVFTCHGEWWLCYASMSSFAVQSLQIIMQLNPSVCENSKYTQFTVSCCAAVERQFIVECVDEMPVSCLCMYVLKVSRFVWILLMIFFFWRCCVILRNQNRHSGLSKRCWVVWK